LTKGVLVFDFSFTDLFWKLESFNTF